MKLSNVVYKARKDYKKRMDAHQRKIDDDTKLKTLVKKYVGEFATEINTGQALDLLIPVVKNMLDPNIELDDEGINMVKDLMFLGEHAVNEVVYVNEDFFDSGYYQLH